MSKYYHSHQSNTVTGEFTEYPGLLIVCDHIPPNYDMIGCEFVMKVSVEI